MEKALNGRIFDPSNPNMGRFNKKRIKKVFSNTKVNLDELLEKANLKRYETTGNRFMVFLTACSVACYKGMIEEEIPRDWADLPGLTGSIRCVKMGPENGGQNGEKALQSRRNNPTFTHG